MDVKNIGEKGIELIKSFEGCHLKAYNATGVERYLTIGWGHYGPDVYPGMIITQERADEMFIEDLQRYVAYVNNPDYVTITYELNQNQFDALVSFCYNCGPGSLKEACKGKRTPEEIAVEIIKYNKGSGKVLPGLVRRREAEIALFNLKGGSRTLELQDWQWTMLGDSLTELSKMGGGSDGSKQLLSYEWAQKAYSHELTIDEAVWLIPIVFARSKGVDIEKR